MNINYKCKLITPLIISGAKKEEVELREQSLKGMLRWWFRFYKGATLSLRDLKDSEEKIWGSQNFASRVRIFIKNKNLSYQINKKDYYAYLCMNDRRGRYSNIKRKAFVEGQEFVINFKIFPSFDLNINKELEKTLFFLSNFGGLGARWRRGFGSIMIDKFNPKGNNLKEIAENLKKEINRSVGSENNQGFINLSNTCIYLISKKGFWKSWEEAMDDLRENFYRNLKNNLKLREIAIYGERKVSPLIIQIKNLNSNYYGVVLAWKEWEKWKLFSKFIGEIIKLNYELMEVKI
ncbi:MAG: type III-B CRISPR module RAMP protein Cmr1 [Candidatus Hydrothermales bacterium]